MCQKDYANTGFKYLRTPPAKADLFKFWKQTVCWICNVKHTALKMSAECHNDGKVRKKNLTPTVSFFSCLASIGIWFRKCESSYL